MLPSTYKDAICNLLSPDGLICLPLYHWFILPLFLWILSPFDPCLLSSPALCLPCDTPFAMCLDLDGYWLRFWITLWICFASDCLPRSPHVQIISVVWTVIVDYYLDYCSDYYHGLDYYCGDCCGCLLASRVCSLSILTVLLPVCSLKPVLFLHLSHSLHLGPSQPFWRHHLARHGPCRCPEHSGCVKLPVSDLHCSQVWHAGFIQLHSGPSSMPQQVYALLCVWSSSSTPSHTPSTCFT